MTEPTTDSRIQALEREDIVMFINACFACTGQREFYSSRDAQQVSVDFLHKYTLGNYRRLYARTLAGGINHFNQAMIVQNLLEAGAPQDAEARQEENELITAAIDTLPPQRVYRMFEALRKRRVNNRRTRAVMKRFVLHKRDTHFDSVKYRRRVRLAGRHAHISFDQETAHFLRRSNWMDRQGRRRKVDYKTPIFQNYLDAHWSTEALFTLPFTVAEGLAANQGIGEAEFLERSKGQMTSGERARVQARAGRAGVVVEHDLSHMPLTRLAIRAVTMDPEEREARSQELGHALVAAAERVLKKSPSSLGRIAVVADRSYSTTGSAQKRLRPLAVTLASVYLLRQAANRCFVYWAPDLRRPDVEVSPFGQTDLSTPLVAALRSKPDTVVIISDGYENAPTGLVNQVVAATKNYVDGGGDISFVHVNPVFDAENLAPRPLGDTMPTVGLRDAEDLLTTLGYARFAEGVATLRELERYLGQRSVAFREAVE